MKTVKRKLSGIGTVLLLGLLLVPPADAAQNRNPKAAIEAFLASIRQMEFPPSDPLRQEKLVDEANGYLDLRTMSVVALAGHWQEASAVERETFLNLMGQLVEQVAYPRSVEFLGDLDIGYPEVTTDGNGGAEVHSVVIHEEEALNAPVVYHLHEETTVWKIDDVILDDVSITEDLKYQFDKIIADSSFEGLLERMRERLDEALKQDEG